MWEELLRLYAENTKDAGKHMPYDLYARKSQTYRARTMALMNFANVHTVRLCWVVQCAAREKSKRLSDGQRSSELQICLKHVHIGEIHSQRGIHGKGREYWDEEEIPSRRG